jgi:hypothetical protein
MKTNKIIAAVALTVFATTFAVQAQEITPLRTKQNNVPPAGSSSIGFMINPVTGIRANGEFAAGDFIGNEIAGQGTSPYQMVILGNPLVSIVYKYKLTDRTALRASLGFSGAKFNYKEYVTDDLRVADADPDDIGALGAQVEDIVHYSMSGGGINLGLEFNAGDGNLRFVGGFGLMYSFGGGSMNFTYGNVMDMDDNPAPTIMPIIDAMRAKGTAPEYHPNGVDMSGARPLKRYNVGVVHAFGISLDAGLEWFFMPNVSAGATKNFVPLVYAMQPETYSTFEGYSPIADEILQFDKKISSGSNYLLYGTENFGIQLSFNYYF